MPAQQQQSFDLSPEEMDDFSPELKDLVDRKRFEDERRMEVLQEIGQELDALFREAALARKPKEVQWDEDLRQHNGRYDDQTLTDIKAAGGSQIFLNITRPKTRLFTGQIADMLLPSDGDRNWDMVPSPVPELAEHQSNNENVIDIKTGQPLRNDVGGTVTVADAVESLFELADERAAAARDKIDDWLQECDYNAAVRRMLRKGAVLGTGILKAPVVKAVTRRRWVGTPDRRMLVVDEVKVPVVEDVDPWHFYPDPTAIRPQDMGYCFERHLLNKKRLRALAKQPGFNATAIEYILGDRGEYQTSADAREYLTSMQAISGVTGAAMMGYTKGLYEVIEYTGEWDVENLVAVGYKVPQALMDSQLISVPCKVWFCNGHVLKAVPDPIAKLRSEDWNLGYHLWSPEEDESGVFGFGIPRIMREEQRVINSCWRMIMDNGGGAALPIMIIDKRYAKAADGQDTLAGGRKVFEITEDAPEGLRADQMVSFFDVPANIDMLLKIFETAMAMVDQTTNLPLIAQGGTSADYTKTAQGLSMLQDNFNTVLRSAVKRFDDCVTDPVITTFYRWMQEFAPDPRYTNGDLNVVARGSSHLYEKGQQAQRLMQFAQLVGGSEEMSIRVDWTALTQELAKALRCSSVVLAKDAIKQKVQQRDQAPPPVDPMVEVKKAEVAAMTKRIEVDGQWRQQQIQSNERMSMAKVQALLAEIASRERITVEQASKKYGVDMIKEDGKRKMFNAEMAAKLTHATADGKGV